MIENCSSRRRRRRRTEYNESIIVIVQDRKRQKKKTTKNKRSRQLNRGGSEALKLKPSRVIKCARARSVVARRDKKEDERRERESTKESSSSSALSPPPPPVISSRGIIIFCTHTVNECAGKYYHAKWSSPSPLPSIHFYNFSYSSSCAQLSNCLGATSRMPCCCHRNIEGYK